MAKTTLNAPEGITYPAGRLEFACESDTVGEALQQLVAKEPRLKPRIFGDRGQLWVGVFVNGHDIRQLQRLETPLADGDEIKLVPSIGGG